MTSPSAAPRRIQIAPLSARVELAYVIRVGMAITIGVWIYLASNAASSDDAPGRRSLLPFQTLIADRAPVEQRMFRELQEGLLEAERARSGGGSWPAIESLAGAGIPPFAADPTRRLRYDWRLLQQRTIVNYLGIPQSAGAPAWLVLVVEPEPGVPPDQPNEDEEHHRLAGGPMLHVSTWLHAGGARVAAKLVAAPQVEGWTQVYARGPAPARR